MAGGGGRREKKGADISKQAARALCIKKQVVAGSPSWLITGKHFRGYRVRVGDKSAAALSFEPACSA